MSCNRLYKRDKKNQQWFKRETVYCSDISISIQSLKCNMEFQVTVWIYSKYHVHVSAYVQMRLNNNNIGSSRWQRIVTEYRKGKGSQLHRMYGKKNLVPGVIGSFVENKCCEGANDSNMDRPYHANEAATSDQGEKSPADQNENVGISRSRHIRWQLPQDLLCPLQLCQGKCQEKQHQLQCMTIFLLSASTHVSNCILEKYKQNQCLWRLSSNCTLHSKAQEMYVEYAVNAVHISIHCWMER